MSKAIRYLTKWFRTLRVGIGHMGNI